MSGILPIEPYTLRVLVEITVENVAIIERAQLNPGRGFSVLTGETGAGKSLLVDAIELALGERADSDLVRHGAARASVAAAFDLSHLPEARRLCEEAGFELEANILFIQRDVHVEGRSQCRVGGRLVPVAALRGVGRMLVDLHGQHDHQSLLHPERHLEFLDLWIGEQAVALQQTVGEAFRNRADLAQRLRAMQTSRRDREQRIDMLRFQIEEIEALNPVPGEMAQLESDLGRLTHAERIGAAASEALAAVGDRDFCAYDALAGAVKSLEEMAKFDASLEQVLAPLRDALYSAEEGVRALRSYLDTVELDPQRLEETASRIDGLKRLRRKYGEDEVAVVAFLDEARRELAILEDDGSSEEELVARVAAAEEALREACRELTALRTEKAKEFAKLVQGELHDLAMEKAVFSVSLQPKEPDASGADDVTYLFSANAGEPPRALNKIASGGELSRVMLAIKSALAGRAGVPTLIFDEVDAGLSGRAAATVARKLEALGQHYQVIAISHLPQIASRAARHFRIEKSESEGRVRTHVRELGNEERIEELARMIAGDTIGDSALAHAREMLAH